MVIPFMEDLILKVSVIIPSLNPDNKLIQVVDALVAKGFDDIILVNDGSDKAHMQPFLQLKEYSQCTILKIGRASCRERVCTDVV